MLDCRRFVWSPLAAVFVILTACNDPQEPAESAAEPGPSAAAERRYQWFLESTTPGGTTVVVESGDGRIRNESFVHWNNREYTLRSEVRLDADGWVASQRLTGTSPFGAGIDETFERRDGVATWRTPGEGGSRKSDEPAFYVPSEWGAVESMAALVRVASRAIDQSVLLYPDGTATVRNVDEQVVATPEGRRNLTLYAITGISFSPSYLWLDEQQALAAVASPWLGMVPEGWDPSILKQLVDAQLATDARLMAEQARTLAHRAGGDIAIDGVNVVDVVDGRVLSNRSVRLSNGKIVAIGPQGTDAPASLRIDGTGKYLVPGLWDMHGHFGLADGVLNIAGGITSVRDIGGEHDQVMDLTRKFDDGTVIGPRTYRAGFMDRAGPFAAGWAADSLDDALERVDFFADHGYLQVKLYSSIEPDWVAPIAERAHARGLRVSGHIPAYMSAEQAVRAGYDEIQHINMVFLNFLAGDREDTRKQLRFTLYGDEAGNLDLDSKAVRDFVRLLVDNDVVVDATAAIFETQLVHHSGDPDPTFAAVVDHLPPTIARRLYNPEMDMGDQVDAWARSSVRQSQMLKLLHDSGVQLVAGSDNIAAFTLHRELEVYAEAGIPAADVLRIATLDSARVVGVADRTGSVEVGKDADLVLLTGNPLEDISAVRRATLVIKGDTLYRPDDLYTAVGVRPFVASESLVPGGDVPPDADQPGE